jgi:hypothetical protein
VSAMLGASTIVWAASTRVLDPREIGWVMHGDWQIHQLGWQFFRHEPWQFPPGVTTTALVPIGTSVGYTDSIPLVALLLKPIADWLPNPLQYLGLWFLVCFTLQGFFGSLVISTWTPRRSLQVLGAMFFVVFPTLTSRIAHPALCAHWLLLWAIWLNWRSAPRERADYFQHGALGLIGGLVHPYLAVMVLALLGALAARRLVARLISARAAVTALAVAVAAVAIGWWASGLFIPGAEEESAAETGRFSMNLLAVVNPGPRAFLLPGFRVVSLDQFGEGFQYLGAGVLALALIAAPLALLKCRTGRAAIPLVVVLLALAFYSVMPQIAIGTFVLIDLTEATTGLTSVFRSTGRFFWPVGYALVAAIIGVVARELKPAIAAALLTGAFAVQLVDLHQWWVHMHYGSRTSEFYAWDMPLQSETWRELLPRYRHMRLYFPEFCRGPVAAPTPAAAFLASTYGLSLNDGLAARVSPSKQADACRMFGDDFTRGFLDDETVYLLTPALMAEFQARLGGAADCRTIDSVGVCVSSRSLFTRPHATAEKAPWS